MKRKALFPGSFDPFTKGHESVINKALPLFDEIIIGVGFNTNKKYFYSLESRIKHIEEIYGGNPKISVHVFKKLTVDYCKETKCDFILRGLRDTKDFEYEKSIAQMNFKLSGVETVFFITEPSVAPISATIVREIVKNDGDISEFVTNCEILVPEVC